MTTSTDKTERIGDTPGAAEAGLAPTVNPIGGRDLRSELREWKNELLSAIREENAGVDVSSAVIAYGIAAEPRDMGSDLQTGHALADVGQAVKSDASELCSRAETYVIRQPWKSVGIAAGVGFVLGLFWNRRH
jgi:ElaB/YqjD/DUF883 family membrane-anchored ribosome-binding protein